MSEESKVKTVDEIPFNELVVSKYTTLFMPHFNQNARLKIEARSVWDSETPCIRLHGRCGKNVIVSEPNNQKLYYVCHAGLSKLFIIQIGRTFARNVLTNKK